MSFIDSVPVRSVGDSPPRFDSSPKQGGAQTWNRQSINISSETAAKVAKEKLTSAIKGKASFNPVAYNRFGSLDDRETIGQNISTKA